MHDINKIREEPNFFLDGWRKRGLNIDVNQILKIDSNLREIISDIQSLQERRNKISKIIGKVKSEENSREFSELNIEAQDVKDKIPKLEKKKLNIEKELKDILFSLPNIPSDDIPIGEDEKANIEIKKNGLTDNDKSPPHYEIGEKLNEIDFETASELSGSRFMISSGNLAKLERALANFMIDTHTSQHGYQEINIPYLVKEDIMFGTGQLPKFRDDQYKTDNDLWLIPTAEVPLTNLVRKKLLMKRNFL